MLGAGVMGGGIAQLVADKGLPVRMKDMDPKALAHGYAAAGSVWREALKKRRLTPREMAAQDGPRLGDASTTPGSRAATGQIEAVVEKLEVKRAVLPE